MSSTQTTSHLVWTKGRGRGFRPGATYSPARRPGEKKSGEETEKRAPTHNMLENDISGAVKKKPTERETALKFIAKHSYKANQDSPLGAELNLTIGQYVTLVEKHKDNEMWCKVVNKEGVTGFVPTKYLQEVQERITTLPWLANKQIDEDKDNHDSGVKVPYKPYVSAYNKPEAVVKPEKDLKQYYCDICEKQLNGPQPYKSHMLSKAHKLEVELAEERERDDAAAAAS